MQVESSSTPLLTIDEVEKVQLQRIASFIGHVFQLTYAVMIHKFVQQYNQIRISGCLKIYPQKHLFSTVFFLHARGNAPSYPLQQLLTLLTVKYIRQLYPVSMLLYSPLIS